MLFGSRVSGERCAAVGASFVVKSDRPIWRFPDTLCSSFDSSVEGVERVCLWPPAFNQARRSRGRFTSRLAPIRGAVRATASFGGALSRPSEQGLYLTPLAGVAANRRLLSDGFPGSDCMPHRNCLLLSKGGTFSWEHSGDRRRRQMISEGNFSRQALSL